MSLRRLCQLITCLPLLAAGGCSSAGGQLGTLQTQNRSLLEQNKAQLAEIENLKTHAHRLEDKLIDAERRLASLAHREPEEEHVAAVPRDLPKSLWDPSNDPLQSDATSVDTRENPQR